MPYLVILSESEESSVSDIHGGKVCWRFVLMHTCPVRRSFALAQDDKEAIFTAERYNGDISSAYLSQ